MNLRRASSLPPFVFALEARRFSFSRRYIKIYIRECTHSAKIIAPREITRERNVGDIGAEGVGASRVNKCARRARRIFAE